MSVNLQDLLPDVRKVNVGKGEVEVFSLNVEQFARLLGKYGKTLELFFVEGKPDMAMIQTIAPDMVKDIMVMAIQAEGQEEAVKRIPLAAQIEILLTAWELSVPDVKKLTAKLQGLVESVKGLSLPASPVKSA